MKRAGVSSIRRLVLASCWLLVFAFSPAHAQQDPAVEALTKQIVQAVSYPDTEAALEEAKRVFFKDNKYNEYVEYLRSLISRKKSAEHLFEYYCALTRYEQLRHLEETQSWDEYFAQGNAYRNEISEYTKRVIFNTAPSNLLHVKGRLLVWQFHRIQQDAFHEQALEDLMNDAIVFAQATKDTLAVKDIADAISSFGEKGKASELYKLYAQKLITLEIKDDMLKQSADSFYKEGNLALSEMLYNAYLERIANLEEKDKYLSVLIGLAKDFMYKDKGESDPAYAEKLFEKAELVGGKEALNQELIYLRAFNLEKAKEYPKAKEVYEALLERFPSSGNADEAEFKRGIILTYILRDPKAGKSSFEKLSLKETVSSHVILSLYQLGLLSEWEGDILKAKECFAKVFQKAGDAFTETVALAKERLKEIEDAKPIEYNLKTFLDLSLKQENALYDMTKSEIHANGYRNNINDQVNISTATSTSPSGCMQVEIQYLWSGHLGKELPATSKPSFNTTYLHQGTKEINLVVVQPSGVVDRSIDMVDVY